eukprot:scaffold66_cov233-Pinguiococcus_pyrenoidosus.AAC.5
MPTPVRQEHSVRIPGAEGNRRDRQPHRQGTQVLTGPTVAADAGVPKGHGASAVVQHGATAFAAMHVTLLDQDVLCVFLDHDADAVHACRGHAHALELDIARVNRDGVAREARSLDSHVLYCRAFSASNDLQGVSLRAPDHGLAAISRPRPDSLPDHVDFLVNLAATDAVCPQRAEAHLSWDALVEGLRPHHDADRELEVRGHPLDSAIERVIVQRQHDLSPKEGAPPSLEERRVEDLSFKC